MSACNSAVAQVEAHGPRCLPGVVVRVGGGGGCPPVDCWPAGNGSPTSPYAVPAEHRNRGSTEPPPGPPGSRSDAPAGRSVIPVWLATSHVTWLSEAT